MKNNLLGGMGDFTNLGKEFQKSLKPKKKIKNKVYKRMLRKVKRYGLI